MARERDKYNNDQHIRYDDVDINVSWSIERLEQYYRRRFCVLGRREKRRKDKFNSYIANLPKVKF